MGSQLNLKVSGGEDHNNLEAEIQRLVDTAGWQLQNGDEIQKTYHCRTWTKISDYNSITFFWKTHSPPGLSQKDVHMADFCDSWAQVVKTVPAGSAPSCSDGNAT
ncbi:hypothetical protein PENANT_c009G08319 [Penicillium antarcticum]|uniref:Uncharacterized protein n=1 Tax=Penicillium antarcticum TaxID=416450 RepID=A0A1V6Q9E0_9EURO|nr:hypothetical protein PENANT_c009G08319 [Penicillium antarcticum]